MWTTATGWFSWKVGRADSFVPWSSISSMTAKPAQWSSRSKPAVASVKIDYTLPTRRSLPARAFLAEPTGEPQARPHRLARVLALAHRLDEMVRSGAVSDYGALARLGQVSPARICQLMTLLHLAPAIQEYLLYMTTAEDRKSVV